MAGYASKEVPLGDAQRKSPWGTLCSSRPTEFDLDNGIYGFKVVP